MFTRVTPSSLPCSTKIEGSIWKYRFYHYIREYIQMTSGKSELCDYKILVVLTGRLCHFWEKYDFYIKFWTTFLGYHGLTPRKQKWLGCAYTARWGPCVLTPCLRAHSSSLHLSTPPWNTVLHFSPLNAQEEKDAGRPSLCRQKRGSMKSKLTGWSDHKLTGQVMVGSHTYNFIKEWF